MKLIEDLGLIEFGTQGRKIRYGIYECIGCKKHIKQSHSRAKTGNHKCHSCACRLTTHNMTNHRLYYTWRGMIYRTNNVKSPSFKYYGGMGVEVCERWKDFNSFIEDMYPTFQEGLTLDRINNDGNYEPSNCRWETKEGQAINRRKIKKCASSYIGVTYEKQINRWGARIKVDKKSIRIGCFDTELEAHKARVKYIIDNNLPHPIN